MMEEGQDPKLPLLMRAMEGSWCENSSWISEGVMKEEEQVRDIIEGGESFGFFERWILESPLRWWSG